MSRRVRGLLRSLVGLAIVVAVIAHVGVAPVRHGLAQVDVPVLLVGLGLTAVTTVASAYRWRVVAAGFGHDLPLRAAVGAYYRSQFLNSVLPGGILGDVDRAVRAGRSTDDLAGSATAVAGERTAGQLVQLAVAAAVLPLSPLVLAWPSTVMMVGLAVAAALAAVGVVVVARVRRGWPAVVGCSIVVVIGHATALLVAARAVGITAPTTQVLAVAVLLLLATSIPLSIGGWGPREGAAAWLFAAAGWGADHGLATATVFGVMALVATGPGAVVLVVDRLRSPTRSAATRPHLTARLEPSAPVEPRRVRLDHH